MLIEQNPDPAGKLMVFLHLPKTAGVSMHNLLIDLFGEGYFRESQTKGTYIKDLSQSESQRIVCISGHFKWGVHRKVNREALYFTVVRDPIERLISLYNHKLRRNNFNNKNDRPPSIDQWMKDVMNGVGRKVYSQCEAISGKNDFEHTSKHLQVNYLLFSDLTQVDSFAQVLQKYLGVSDPRPLPLLNRRPDDQQKVIPSDAVLSLMRDHYAADIELVEFCRSQFEQVLFRQSMKLSNS